MKIMDLLQSGSPSPPMQNGLKRFPFFDLLGGHCRIFHNLPIFYYNCKDTFHLYRIIAFKRNNTFRLVFNKKL